MKKKQCEGEVNLIKLFGVSGLLAYFLGVLAGYQKGFLGDHRAVRLAGRALLFTTVFMVGFIVVYKIYWFQKNVEGNASIAQAAEEEQGLEDTETEAENLLRLPNEVYSDPVQVKPAELPETEETEKLEPLDDSVIKPVDIYAEKGNVAAFRAYHPEALEYQWEIYDVMTGNWTKTPQEAVVEREDELQRVISSLELLADQEWQVRCQISTKEDTISCEAILHILSDQISSISVDEFSANAGSYASTSEVPVEITYQDGSKESIIGLSGLYFLEQSESSEDSTTMAGNMQETITTVRTMHEYDYIDPGSKEGMLLYRGSGKNVDIPIPVNIVGLDQTAPQIMAFTVSNFEVSNVDKVIPVTVTIKAEDDMTPLRQLTYALLPEGEEPKEEDWIDQPVFQADITKNGIWTAYCRDEAGNIAKREQEIIAVDNKAPTIRLILEQEEWCQDNKIFVSVEDSLSVEYRYFCEETGEDSGWISESSKSVGKNGTWKIQVRDAAGNIAEEEITVDNIDTEAPVIRGIKEKSEGETKSNEK